MKEITLKVTRQTRTKNTTIGELTIDGQHFCWTLEDFDRDLNQDGDLNDTGETKVYGETCIPKGTYAIKLTMSPHFKRITPELQNVPGFQSIRMHGGNTKVDTLGCLLIAYNKFEDRIQGSAEKDLTEKLKEFNKITIQIT
jgi:hypothetical protein